MLLTTRRGDVSMSSSFLFLVVAAAALALDAFPFAKKKKFFFGVIRRQLTHFWFDSILRVSDRFRPSHRLLLLLRRFFRHRSRQFPPFVLQLLPNLTLRARLQLLQMLRHTVVPHVHHHPQYSLLRTRPNIKSPIL